MKKEIIIILSPLKFVSKEDKEYYSEWIKKIPCIKKIDILNKENHLYFKTKDITEDDLFNLIALFDRYNIKNKTQLEIFKNHENEYIFADYNNKEKPRMQSLYRFNFSILDDNVAWEESKKKNVILTLFPLLFHTQEDKNTFFELIKSITCQKKFDGVGPALYLYISANKILKDKFIISENDFLNLKMLFKRYNLKYKTQLNIFYIDKKER